MERLRDANATSNAFAVVGAIVSAASAVSINSATTLSQLNNSVYMSNAAISMLQSAQILASLQLLKYSRDDETQADLDGVDWMANAAFDPVEAVKVWERLEAEQEAAGENAGFSLLSTHPAPERRIRDLTAKIDGLSVSTDGNRSEDSILEVIDSYREDWIVDEMRVLHPDQFLHLIEGQRQFGVPIHSVKYLSALSYIDASGRQGFSNREKREFIASATTLLEEASVLERSVEVPEMYRELGKLKENSGDTEGAKQAYKKYLELLPDAWDARFIQRKL